MVFDDVMILAGDIGGTKTHLALFTHSQTLVAEARYPSQHYSGLLPILQQFLHTYPAKLSAACFGVAGTIRQQCCTLPNLPTWQLTAEELKQFLNLSTVTLLNDLEAMGWGIPCLTPEQLYCLQVGEATQGHAVLLAAGTGLGESCLYWNGAAHVPLATEGGHCDFAPRNECEIGLLRYLQRQFAHVSYERVLSGSGLVHIYLYLCEYYQQAPLPAIQTALIQGQDPSALISSTAFDICQEAVTLFIRIYGAEAGNFALKFMSVGGVYIGGGIAPKILSQLQDGTFIHAFTDKGRFAGLMRTIPVSVILMPEVGLWGAARYASLSVLQSSREL